MDDFFNKSSLEIEKVNKFESDWDSSTLFSGFNVRAILKTQEDVISQVSKRHQLTRRLRREIGEEGTDWKILNNSITGEDELYLPNSGKLLMWKLQDVDGFLELFERVEQHSQDVKMGED